MLNSILPHTDTIKTITGFYYNYEKDITPITAIAGILGLSIFPIFAKFINVFIFFMKKIMKKQNDLIDQAKIYSANNFSFPGVESIKIKDLPKELVKYRNKLNLKSSGNNNINEVVYFGPMRISTFFAFWDGEQVLFYERNPQKNKTYKDLKPINIKGLDCFGALSFSNNSLERKLPPQLLDATVTKNDIEFIDGLAIEETQERWLSKIFKTKNPSEAVIMIGFLIKIPSELFEKIQSTHIFREIRKKQQLNKYLGRIFIRIYGSNARRKTFLKNKLSRYNYESHATCHMLGKNK